MAANDPRKLLVAKSLFERAQHLDALTESWDECDEDEKDYWLTLADWALCRLFEAGYIPLNHEPGSGQ